uniref:Gag-Pol polyprotein n=1 Tax=Tanacetum cinerariifolium TaxID=118510 RepID=A0A699GVQ6_TANCI|nr:Gag-Pol polyprotein [Tanacetum cinerariifolium]
MVMASIFKPLELRYHNDLARKYLVRGLPRLKFEKDHLCFACQLGKSKKHTHKPKTENTNLEVLNTLHMDLCGPMRVQTINGKKYILVIVDDYSRFTWVKFLRSKDETLEVVIKFLQQIQVNLYKTVRYIRIDNGTKFVNKALTEYYERISIFHQKTVPRTPQQNDIVKRRNRTLVEAAQIMLIFSKAPIEDLGKLQPTADVGIFVGYAPSRKGLVPNPVPAALYVPPTNKDLEILFQPMFDEYLEPPRVGRLVSPTLAVQALVNSAGTPSSATIDQDAPSPSISPSSLALKSHSLHQGIATESTFMKDNPVAPVDNNPFINVFASKPSSDASSFEDVSLTESTYVSQTLHHISKWSKDYPLNNVIGNPSRPVSTRKQLATDALWCLYNSVLSKVKPKNFKSGITKDCWFQAMQDEIHKFDRLQEMDTQEKDKNKAKNDKTEHEMEKIKKDKVIRSQKSKVKARDTMADVNVNALANQALTMAPPTRTDDKIMPHIRWVPTGKSNCYLDIEMLQSNRIYKIAVDIMKHTNFFRAFTASSTIPSIYIQQQKEYGTTYSRKKKDTLIVIPSIRFTKLIIYYLRRKHKFHPRPDSPLHLPNEEPVLRYLKFSAKGTKREVFGMPILDTLITADIQGEPYYKEYLEKVAKHQRYLVGEKGSDPDSPALKPTNATKKSKPSAPKADLRPLVIIPASSQQHEPKPPPAKSQGKKRKLVTETADKPSPARRSKPGLVTKRRKPTSSLRSVDGSIDKGILEKAPRFDDEEADIQRAVEESLKSVYDVPRGPLPPVVVREPESGKYQPLPEKKSHANQFIFQRRTSTPNESSGHDESSSLYAELGLTDSEVESDEYVLGIDAGVQDEGQAGPNPGDATASQPQSSHVVHAGPNLEHMDLEATDVSTQLHPEQMDEGFTATAYPKVQENFKLTVEEQFRDLPEADMKEILHQRMWETNSYKTHEDHMMLYEALEKSMNRDHTNELLKDWAEARNKKKKRRDLPKTPFGSPPHQPPPTSPPAGPSGTSGSPGASGSSKVPPPPPPPPSTNQEGQSHGSTAPSSSKTAALAEYKAWTMTDTGVRPSVSSTPEDLHMDDDMAPFAQPLKEDRPVTPKLAWSIPSSDLPVLKNNWASALASTYLPPPEDLLLAQTGDMAMFMDWLYLRYGSKGSRPALSISKMKAAYYPDVGLEQMVPDQMWIKEECKYDIAAMYGISHW